MIEKYRKEVLIYTSTALCLIFVLLYFLFIFNTKKVTEININDYFLDNSSNYICNINKVNGDDYISVEGFIYEDGVKIEKSSIQVVLYDKKLNKLYAFPTYVKSMENKGLDKDYAWSGYKAYIDSNRIGDENNYDVYLITNFNDNEKLVNLNENLSNIEE